MNRDLIYKIEWKYSDAGTLQYVRPFLERMYKKENLSPQDIIPETLLNRVQNNDELLGVYYTLIENTFNIDWNSLKLDDDNFDQFSADLTLMLATQLEAIENKRFPELGDECWVNVLLNLDERCESKKTENLSQDLTGRTHIQLPISTFDIQSNNNAIGYKFDQTFGTDDFLVFFSVSSGNCSDEKGWREFHTTSDNFVRVNSNDSSTIMLNWCGSSIEDTNLCLSLYSNSDYPKISLRKQASIKKTMKTSEYGDYKDFIDDENLQSCPGPEDIESGSCWISETGADCKGKVDGCKYEQVKCGITPNPPIVAGAIGASALVLIIVIAAVIIHVKKKRNSSRKHPAESAHSLVNQKNLSPNNPAPTKPASRKNRTGYSFY